MEKNNVKLHEVRKINSIKEMMEQAFSEAADKPAYRFKNAQGEITDVTYGEVECKINALGAFLNSIGADKAHVACIGPNSFSWILVYLTVLRSGGVFVPVDKDLPVADIVNVLTESDAETLFLTQKYEEMLVDSGKLPPNIKRVINIDRAEDDGMLLSFDKAMEKGAQLDPSGYLNHTRSTDELKMIVYTSGTTGIAKGVMLSEHNLVSSVYYGMQTSTVYDVGLSVLPYHHTYEAVSDILVSFHHHSVLCLNENLMTIIKNLHIYKPDYIYVVPAMAELFYNRIIRSLQKEDKLHDFQKLANKSNGMRKVGIDIREEAFASMREIFGGNLRKIVCGGAAVRPTVSKFFDDIGIDFVIGYGITECSPLVSANNDFDIDTRTAGVVLPCASVKVFEPNEEGIGELCVKGDIVMMGYYKQPELTAEAMHRGWFFTGDFGFINEKGHLIICGRKKNVIVLANGKNIYPEEIEGYIQEIDYVNEVVVSSGVDDKGNESSLTAEVFLSEVKTGSEVLKAIKNACRDLPIYKQISSVRIRDKEFEKTTTNKIKRFGQKKDGENEKNEKSEKSEKTVKDGKAEKPEQTEKERRKEKKKEKKDRQ